MPPLRTKSAAAKGPASIAEGLPLHSKQEAMALILDRLEDLTDKSGRSVSDLFLELPDREDYPDYYAVIKKPIALDTIRERLTTGKYENATIEDFGRDLRTMTANAKSYNRDGSMVYRDATTLESYIDVAIRALKDDSGVLLKKEEAGFSTEFCLRILDVIVKHEDKSGRQLAELFLELPSKEEYPDYYEDIEKPIAIDIIERNIDKGKYPTLESFEKDVNLMFDNAKLYNAEGSDVYLDAEALQQLFWKTIGKNGRGRMAKGKRQRKHENELSEVVHLGETYQVGDFVHIQNDSDPSKPTIGLIFSLWQDEKGILGMDASWFLRPEHIVHPYASRFYPGEVVKASGLHEHLVSDIQGRCFVLQTKDYIRGRPMNCKPGQSIYLCEQRYNDSYKSVSKIKNWATCLPPGHKPGDIQLRLHPQPLTIKKLPSASMVDKAGKVDSSESISRGPTPRRTSSTYASSSEPSSEPEANPEPEPSPEPEPPRPARPNKRKSSHMLPESSPSDAIMADIPAKAKLARTEPPFAVAHLERQPPFTTPSPSAGPPSQLSAPPLSSHGHFRCNYPNVFTKQYCTAVLSTEEDLREHMAIEHTSTPNISTSSPALKRGRPKKSPSDIDPQISIPPTGSTAVDHSGYQRASSYNSYNHAGPYGSSQYRPPLHGEYPVAPYQSSQPQQSLHYAHHAHHSLQQEASYSQPSHSQRYPPNYEYEQSYEYGSVHPMHSQPVHTQPQEQGYHYGRAMYQQGHLGQEYPSHPQSLYVNDYSQPYSSAQGVYPQQQHGQTYTHHSYQNQSRHLPPPHASSQNLLDRDRRLSHDQQLAQDHRLAQQQQVVQQQYTAQQRQFAHQHAQQDQLAHHQQDGYGRRSMSQSRGISPQLQQQQPQYTPQSPVSIAASQPYASVIPLYQQQPYTAPTSLANGTRGHASYPNISSRGSVSTVINAMEGVGLGLSGVSASDRGHVAVPMSSSDAASPEEYSLKGGRSA
ncbi:hypothetical protein BGZ98_000039 [Dissophora globulifera]|nr:hypothetical protein BGZ98_000039 [Dissophora globulifera]